MVTADARRTPSFVLFLKPDYFGDTQASPGGAAWNHGTIAPEINTTWLGLVGPGVRSLGVDRATWADESDIRPTVLFLAGLSDRYRHDGRVLVEAFDAGALGASYQVLAVAYKRIDAPLGDLAMKTLAAATVALAGSSAGDAGFREYAARAAALEADRDRLAAQMAALLEGAAFKGSAIDPGAAEGLVEQSNALLGRNV
jgi:hypothetical protein